MAAKKAKPDEIKQEESKATDLERTENHLNNNPWLRGIYDEAKSIAALDPAGAVLKPGLSAEELFNRAEVIRNGDYEPNETGKVLVNHEATAVPEAYFTFLFLIGGFRCRSVRLYHLGSDFIRMTTGSKYGHSFSVPGVSGLSVREKVMTGRSFNGSEKCYPVQITLGRCDHGEYVYDRRQDNYSLIGFGQVTNFNSCADMLNHAMYRARKNIEENWTEKGSLL